MIVGGNEIAEKPAVVDVPTAKACGAFCQQSMWRNETMAAFSWSLTPC